MTPNIWDDYLSSDDRKMVAARKPRVRTGFGNRPALLVIDMQLSAIGEDRPAFEQIDRFPTACGKPAWAALRHLETLIPRVRKAGLPVIYTRHVYYPHSGLPQAEPSYPVSALNPLSEIPNEIAMADTDLLLEKNVASAFFHTGLIYMLLNLNIDSLLVVGNSTSGCVRSSVIDATGYKFKVSVIEECVFDRVEASHALSLFDLQFKYCDVVKLDEVYDLLDQYIGSKGA